MATPELSFHPNKYFDAKRADGTNERVEHTVVRKATTGNTDFYIATSASGEAKPTPTGVLVVSSPNTHNHYIRRLILPESDQRDPTASLRMHAMLTFTAFNALRHDREARIFAQVHDSDFSDIQTIYDDKSNPRVWEQYTTINEGRTRIMGALAHRLIGYDGIVFKDNNIAVGNPPYNDTSLQINPSTLYE